MFPTKLIKCFGIQMHTNEWELCLFILHLLACFALAQTWIIAKVDIHMNMRREKTRNRNVNGQVPGTPTQNSFLYI